MTIEATIKTIPNISIGVPSIAINELCIKRIIPQIKKNIPPARDNVFANESDCLISIFTIILPHKYLN